SLVGAVTAPIVSGITPSQALNVGTANARISGLNFQAGGSVTLQRNGQPSITGANVVVESNRSITADFDLTDRAAGAWDVVVRNPDGQEGRLPGAFNIVDAAPRLTRVTPNTAPAFGTVHFDLTGEVFLAGATARLTRSGQPDIVASAVNVLSATRIRATFDLTGAAVGTWDVVVRNPNGREGWLASALTLRRSQPIIAEINPPNAINFGSVELTFTGSEFLPDVQALLRRSGEADILPTRLTRESETRLRATFDLTAQTPGVWNAVVTNGDGGSGQNSFEIRKSSPIIREFTPDSATTLDDTVEVVIKGGRFFTGSRVRLVGGGPPLEAQSVVLSPDGAQINAVFRPFGAPGGRYLLEVDNPLTHKASAGPFRIREPRLHIDVVAPPRIVIGLREQIFITAFNRSDMRQAAQIKFDLPTIDTGGERFIVHFRVLNLEGQELARGIYNGIPVLITLKPDLGPFETHHWILEMRALPAPRSNPVRQPQPEVKRAVPLLVVGIAAAGLFYAGTLVLDAACEIAIKSNLQLEAVMNGVEIDPDFRKIGAQDQDRLRQLVENIFAEAADEVKGQIIDKIKEVLAENSTFIKLITENKLDELANEIHDAGEVIQGKKSPFEYLAEKVQDKLGDIIKDTGLSETAAFILAKASLELFLDAAKDCLKKSEELSRLLENSSMRKRLSAPLVRPTDPNAKSISAGINGFITADEKIQFLVEFENLPTATGAAHEVVITDVIDSNLDLNTLTFIQVGFGEHRVLLPPNASTINTDVDLRPARNLVVQIRGSVDSTTRTMTVTFRGIDPTTGDLHRDGFLPPNQNPPEGQGFVGFSVKPLPQTPSGTVIRNRASIVFDVESPLETNEVAVTLDAAAPQSAVQSLPSLVPSPTFTVRWDTQDDASGVQDVQLWVAENGGNFRLLDTFPSGTTSVQFSGKFGFTYRFYTAARDKVGHEEPHPTEPDAITTVGAPPPIGAGLRIVSLPVKSEIADPKRVFNFDADRWARWNPEANGGQGAYAMYPDPFTLFTDPEQVLGKGFWALLTAPVVPNARGDLPAEGSQVVIPFKPGWNLLGNPLLSDLIWNSLRVRVNGQERTLREAQAAGWVEEYGWGFEPDNSSTTRGRYVLLDDPAHLAAARGVVRPFEGFWFFARRSGELVVTVPPLAQRVLNASVGTLRHRRGAGTDGWMTELSLSAGGASVGSVFIGATGDGKPMRILQPPPAPTGAKNIRISLEDLRGRRGLDDGSRDGGAGNSVARLAAVLDGEATRGEWTVLVESDAPAGEEL
ncbi:MAG: hypothetical protein NZT92_17770, partial [Abditibacteriales bacterium]|nr:hypothetical protein [Abditibacteriales bacterium]MDW8367694.1 hypothetical protein [Abditibacteriales bacterium]